MITWCHLVARLANNAILLCWKSIATEQEISQEIWLLSHIVINIIFFQSGNVYSKQQRFTYRWHCKLLINWYCIKIYLFHHLGCMDVCQIHFAGYITSGFSFEMSISQKWPSLCLTYLVRPSQICPKKLASKI